MNTKIFNNSRYCPKGDIEANWNKAVGFVPLDKEIIIYKADAEHPVARFKIGDGKTVVQDLPFAGADMAAIEKLIDEKGELLVKYVDNAVSGLATEEYVDEKVASIEIPEITVDQTYNSESENAQSGNAVSEAIDNLLVLKAFEEKEFSVLVDIKIGDNKTDPTIFSGEETTYGFADGTKVVQMALESKADVDNKRLALTVDSSKQYLAIDFALEFALFGNIYVWTVADGGERVLAATILAEGGVATGNLVNIAIKDSKGNDVTSQALIGLDSGAAEKYTLYVYYNGANEVHIGCDDYDDEFGGNILYFADAFNTEIITVPIVAKDIPDAVKLSLTTDIIELTNEEKDVVCDTIGAVNEIYMDNLINALVTNRLIIAIFNITEANTTITLQNLEGMTEIDWGDETINNQLSHTYTVTGEYVCKIYDVTSIGVEAFYNCDSLTSAVIPDSVTSIGYRAFSNCRNLTKLIIPDSVTSIEFEAFFGCSSLMEIVIPDSVTSIGRYAFSGCSSLTEVVIPNSVISIGESVFAVCRSLIEVIIGNSVTSIGNNAFYNCSGLTEVIIGNSVTSIGSSAFYNCSSLRSVTFESLRPLIYNSSWFANCSLLVNIYVPYACKQAYIDKWTVNGATQYILDKIVESDDREAMMSDVNANKSYVDELVSTVWDSLRTADLWTPEHKEYTTILDTDGREWNCDAVGYRNTRTNKHKVKYTLISTQEITANADNVAISVPLIGVNYTLGAKYRAATIAYSALPIIEDDVTMGGEEFQQSYFTLDGFTWDEQTDIGNECTPLPFRGSGGFEVKILTWTEDPVASITFKTIIAKVTKYEV